MRKAFSALGCLLLLLGAYAFVHFNLLCLAVPCDRVVETTVKIIGPAEESAAQCAVQLFDPDGPLPRKPRRTSDIADGTASFTVGPWSPRYRARVSCKGFKPSPLVLLEISDDKATFDLGTVRLEQDPGN
jgi:hypothetical protein